MILCFVVSADKDDFDPTGLNHADSQSFHSRIRVEQTDSSITSKVNPAGVVIFQSGPLPAGLVSLLAKQNPAKNDEGING